MKILAFGHIPTWAGGRQTQGAANVIYNLALNMSNQRNTRMFLAVSDVFVPKIQRDKLTILGWTKKTLFSYACQHPVISFGYFLKLTFLWVKYKNVFSLLGTFFKGLHLRKSIDEVKPDIVHLHGMFTLVYALLVPSKVKIAVTLHGMAGDDVEIPNHIPYSKMEYDVCHSHRIDKIYFITEKLIGDFTVGYGDIIPPIEVICNAYNDQYFYYTPHIKQPVLTICTVASMSGRKGQERVLEGLIKSGIDCQYFCVGSVDGKIKARMDAMVSGSKVKLTVFGPKNPNEIRNILSMSDYMILPSSSEGFGLVFLEAIACGVPVVLPKDLPINDEDGMIKPGVNAILLDNCSAEAICAKVSEMKDNHFDRKKVSETIINYTWDNIAKQYVESMKKL